MNPKNWLHPMPVYLLLMAMCHEVQAQGASAGQVASGEHALSTASSSPRSPRVLDPAMRLTLVAEAPAVVTPISITFDAAGRLLVVESHTHLREETYGGPPGDRIRIMLDDHRDGRSNRFETFFEGTSATMSLLAQADGSLVVATRSEIFRLRDSNGDGRADERTRIVMLDTEGDYPHNGLSGLCQDHAGWIYFGMGENLGAAYQLLGHDGTVLRGQGEGGNVYRCDSLGDQLERIATGLWNPFGMGFDSHGRLFAVDNDPDGRPPCRLLQIVHGGDYGYQFRYGRTGRHPLQAWDGELPGTLPMAAGTGEAPSAVVAHRGRLWVTSWGDYRIERFQLHPRGGACQATSDFVVQGDEHFRPVGLAIAPDGALYFTDWVSRSYPVHGQGRIWRLDWKDPPPDETFPPLSAEEQRATSLQSEGDRERLIEALDDHDPFIRQAAVWGLIRSRGFNTLNPFQHTSAARRLGALQAMRWNGQAPEESVLRQALADPSPEVVLFAVRWIAERQLRSLRDDVAGVLRHSAVGPGLFDAAAAAVQWLDRGEVPSERDYHVRILHDILADSSVPLAVRGLALRRIPAAHPALTTDRLASLLETGDQELAYEVVHTLALRDDEDSLTLLAEVANDASRVVSLRADAVMGLAPRAERYAELLVRLCNDANESVREEAARSLRGLPIAPAWVHQRSNLPATATAAWWTLVGEGGDAEAGRRVFFSAKGGSCGRCHLHSGRGAEVGPDLTEIGRRTDRRRLLDSILQPDRDVAPRYAPWVLATVDGKILTGLAAPQPYSDSRGDQVESFVDRDGLNFRLSTSNIESRRQVSTSIMPGGLEKTITAKELQDLLAFLTSS